MTTTFVVFASVAFWKEAANAKMQQKNPARQDFVGSDSLPDKFSRAEAMPPVVGDVTLLRFGIGFAKACQGFAFQVLKSKQWPL